MNRCFVFSFALAAFASLSSPGRAADVTIRMRCDWKTSTDVTTSDQRSAQGSTAYIYEGNGNGVGKISIAGIEGSFAATATDTMIIGQMEYNANGVDYSERVKINRYTGAVRSWQKTKFFDFVIDGTCFKVDGPLF